MFTMPRSVTFSPKVTLPEKAWISVPATGIPKTITTAIKIKLTNLFVIFMISLHSFKQVALLGGMTQTFMSGEAY